MSDHLPEQLNSQIPGSDSPNSTIRIRKGDKLRDFMEMAKSKRTSEDVNPTVFNQSTWPSSIVSQISNDPPGDNQVIVSTPVTKEAKIQSSLLSSPPNKAHRVMDVFPDNLPKPVIKTDLPHLQQRIESTQQLVYCNSLLLQAHPQ
ncbi:hypothetical protein BGZ90_001798 [Linnemannia elongata]|nr:hypothetical protein BGZ90_001798 [Linnemannia elongata]